MISVFDIGKLQGLLHDFYALSHIRITVFDENLNELVSYPENVAPYCAVIRGTDNGLAACMACDRAACQQAAGERKTRIYQCHAGFTEAVTPLYVGDILVGFLLFGHVFPWADKAHGWEVIKECCGKLNVNREALWKAVMSAVPVPEEKVSSAAHILHAVASYLIMERMATLREDRLSVRLDAYLSAHFTEAIGVPDVCTALGIGKTQLYKLSGQLYGCGVAERIRALRMEKAKKMLEEEADASITSISVQCGYQDYNYFICSFSRDVGETPGSYRKKHRKNREID